MEKNGAMEYLDSYNNFSFFLFILVIIIIIKYFFFWFNTLKTHNNYIKTESFKYKGNYYITKVNNFMTTNIIKVTTTGIKGNFKPKYYNITKQESERQYQQCLIENRIDFLGWF